VFSYLRLRRLLLILKCHAKSPTVSHPETPPSSNNPLISIGDQVFIVVTSDSARSITVDVSNAHDPVSIRERIFTQVGGSHLPDCSRLTTHSAVAHLYRGRAGSVFNLLPD